MEARDAIFVADPATGRLIGANRSACRLVGRTLDEIRSLHQAQLHPPEMEALARELFARSVREPSEFLTEIELLRKDGTRIPVEIAVADVVDPDGRPIHFGVFRDISLRKKVESELRAARETLEERVAERTADLGTAIEALREESDRAVKALEALRLDEARLESLHELARRPFADERELIERALEEAVRLTGSEIGYFHFVEPATGDIELFVWSRRALEGCSAANERHYPIGLAGAWADCARTGRPAVHNDYQALAERKGYPDGHAHVARHLSVPILDGGRVVAIAGVGNKGSDYQADDVRQMELFCDGAWSIVGRSRAEEALRLANERLEERVAQRTAELERSLVDVRVESDRRQAAERLAKESEELYRATFEQAAVGIAHVSLGGVLTRVNRRLCEILGRDERELLGLAIADVTHPDDLETNAAELRRLFAGEKSSFALEKRYLRKDGEVVWGHLTVSLRRDERGEPLHLIAVVEDIGERRRSDEALRTSEARFRGLFSSMAAGVLHQKLDGTVLEVNPAAERILGMRREEILGQSTRDRKWRYVNDDGSALPPDEYPSLIAAREGRIVTSRLVGFDRENGRPIRWLLVNSAPELAADGSGRVVGTYTTFIDVTERKLAEAERQRLEAQVQHVQRLEGLGVMAGGIAHDFNNLLTAIVGQADAAMLELASGSYARECLSEIVATSKKAADLCRQLLAYSGRGRFVVEPLDLSAVVREMEGLISLSVGKRARVAFSLGEDLPAIEADASQIRQIVLNLAINGAEASSAEAGQVRVTTRTCDGESADEGWEGDAIPAGGRGVVLEVSDDGVGMDETTRARIFDPFFTTKFTGRGLGLSAVQGIVRGHHGSIRVDSAPGKGTTVSIRFPALPGAAPRAETVAVAGPRPQSPRGGTLLLVDDEDAVRLAGKRLLERGLGYRVFAAASGEEALGIFREKGGEVDCVLLDLTMPGMDGAAVLEAMIAMRPDVRAILSSGYDEVELAERFAGKGFAGFIQKPYRLQDLEAKIRSVCGR